MNQLQRLALRPTALRTSSPWAILASSSSSSSSLFIRPASTAADNNDDSDPAPLLNLPYKAKKVWPPDFTRLSPQEQLRFEKRYKRRVAIRSERPRWVKLVKLAQLFSITFVVIYGVLFMEWEHGAQPFEGVRAWFWETLGLAAGGPEPAVRKVGSSGDRSASSSKTR